VNPALPLIDRVRAHHWATGKPNILTRFGVADTLGYTGAERSDKIRAWDAARKAGLAFAVRLFGAAVYVYCREGVALVRPFPGPLPAPLSRRRHARFPRQPYTTHWAPRGLTCARPRSWKGRNRLRVPAAVQRYLTLRTLKCTSRPQVAAGRWSCWTHTTRDGEQPATESMRRFNVHSPCSGQVAVPPGDHEVVFHYFRSWAQDRDLCQQRGAAACALACLPQPLATLAATRARTAGARHFLRAA